MVDMFFITGFSSLIFRNEFHLESIAVLESKFHFEIKD